MVSAVKGGVASEEVLVRGRRQGKVAMLRWLRSLWGIGCGMVGCGAVQCGGVVWGGGGVGGWWCWWWVCELVGEDVKRLLVDLSPG